MHGSITVESRLGLGSTFTVVIPMESIEIAPPGTPRKMSKHHVSADPIPSATRPSLPRTNSDRSTESTESTGSVVSSPLPLHPGSLATPTLPTSPTAPQNAARPSGVKASKGKADEHLKILVVDDSELDALFSAAV
jgi:hypothetical protein